MCLMACVRKEVMSNVHFLLACTYISSKGVNCASSSSGCVCACAEVLMYIYCIIAHAC